MRASNYEDKSQEKFCAVSRFIELHTLFYQISNLEEFAIERRRIDRELLIQVKLAVGI